MNLLLRDRRLRDDYVVPVRSARGCCPASLKRSSTFTRPIPIRQGGGTRRSFRSPRPPLAIYSFITNVNSFVMGVAHFFRLPPLPHLQLDAMILLDYP